jgi:hypothetical protein
MSPNKFSVHQSTTEESQDIEPYIGPSGSISDMVGGLLVGELALQVLVGPSQVASGLGLYLCIDDYDKENAIEEIIIPQGTPFCGYARGYFTDEATGDKSVGFQFEEGSAEDKAVFFNKELVSLGDVIRGIIQERNTQLSSTWTPGILWGHLIKIVNDEIYVKSDTDFKSRIFIPEIDKDNPFAATSLGVYANDLAFDPDSNEEGYDEASSRNNILQLVWRLSIEENGNALVPTWPVVIAKVDCRFLNSVPMEVGLQYGYKYWKAVEEEGLSKYIVD